MNEPAQQQPAQVIPDPQASADPNVVSDAPMSTPTVAMPPAQPTGVADVVEIVEPAVAPILTEIPVSHDIAPTSDPLAEPVIVEVPDSANPASTPPVTASPQASVSPPPTPAPPPPSAVIPSAGTGDFLGYLVGNGDISEDVATQVRQEELSTGKSIEDIVTEKKLASEEEIVRAKASAHNIPFVRISDTGTSPEALGKLDESVARRYNILPFSLNKHEGTLLVAMVNPQDLQAIDFAEQKTELRLVVHYAMKSEVERSIAEFYSQNLSSEVTQALEQAPQVQENRLKKQNLSQLSSGGILRDAPINRIVETTLDFAIKARASDIHIEPQESRTRVRYRIDGILQEKLILPQSVHEAVVSRIKILSNLKIDERRVPQDGRFNYATSEQEVDLRVSTLPTIHGEKVVMRLLKKNTTVPSLEDLGLRDLALKYVKEAIEVPHGIILVTGPTGSGKTTTLYSVVNIINRPKVNIMTLEDPVEYKMAGVSQVQVNNQAGLTFASGLRSFLRQDPDVIMVGEIRDSETAELAVQAALTGHLVFSTLHTSSAAGAVPRLLDMGAEPFLLASSLTMAIAQRVVRRINNDYKEEYEPEKAVVDDVKEVLGKKYDNWCKTNKKDPEKMVLFRPKEDRPDTQPEYKGRVAIYEVMRITEGVSKLILERKPAMDMEKLALTEGTMLMKQDGYLKALDGLTTIEEVLRVAEV